MPVKIACLVSLLLIPLHIFADNPSAADIFSSGERYYNSGDYSEAVVMFREFVMDYPADERTPRAFLYLGSSYLKEGRGDLALARYRMVLDYFPYSEEAPSAVFEMGRIYEGKRDYSASVSAYGLIVSNHRDFEEFPYCEYKLVLIPYERLGRSPSLGRLDSVMGDLERVMEKYPGHELYKDAETAWISCQVQKADLLLSARRWNDAREAYRKLLKEYPEYRQKDYLVFRIAYTFNMEGERDRAI